MAENEWKDEVGGGYTTSNLCNRLVKSDVLSHLRRRANGRTFLGIRGPDGCDGVERVERWKFSDERTGLRADRSYGDGGHFSGL